MHGGREPGDFDYLWAGKKGTTMIKGAIFDMDGTLVDNTPVHIRAFEIFCERYGIRDWKEKLGQAYGMGNDDIMRLIMPAEVIREKGLAALAEEKESIYREIYAPEIVPMPGLTDLLQKLRDAGIRCAVGSSGYKPNVDFVLEKCRIEPYFDARISGDMVSRCKPDPEIYLTAAAALGLPAAECVVFEDAPAGIEAARRAGAGHIVALATTLDRAALAQTDAPAGEDGHRHGHGDDAHAADLDQGQNYHLAEGAPISHRVFHHQPCDAGGGGGGKKGVQKGRASRAPAGRRQH